MFHVYPSAGLLASIALACCLLVSLLTYVLYRLQASRDKDRSEVVWNAECDQLALEIDVLLQGFQGVLYMLQAARGVLPATETLSLAMIDDTLERGAAAIEDTRGRTESVRIARARARALRATVDSEAARRG